MSEHTHSLKEDLTAEHLWTAGLPVYHNCLLIFLCPHNCHRTDFLPFIFTLLSEESFLFMFWWFLGSLPNKLSPLLATTVSKASDQHFISSGVNFTAEWEIWKQAMQLEHKTLRFVMMRKANAKNRVTVWPFLLPHSPYKIMTVFYISLATISHLLLAYQMTLSNGSSLLLLHLQKDQRGGQSSAKFLLIHSPFWELLSSFTKKDPNNSKNNTTNKWKAKVKRLLPIQVSFISNSVKAMIWTLELLCKMVSTLASKFCF